MQERVIFNDPTTGEIADVAERVEALRSFQADLRDQALTRVQWVGQKAAKAKAAEIVRAALPHANRAQRREFLANFARQVKTEKKAKALLARTTGLKEGA